MRKVTKLAENAFNKGLEFKQGNTQVIVAGEDVQLFLHGNLIASRRLYRGTVQFSLCGWPSVTTRERLKAAGIDIHQKDGVQYCNSVAIDPDKIYNKSVDGSIKAL